MKGNRLLTCVILIPLLLITACGGGGPVADIAVPTVPANLLAISTTSTQIGLSWTASTDNVGVTGYKIYKGGVYIKTATTTAASDTGLTVSTNYCYTVSAIDAANNESAQSTQACVITQPTSAVVKIFTSGALSSGSQIGGIDMMLILPAGVRVKSATKPPEIDSNIVVASGVASTNSTVMSIYTAATTTLPGKVRVMVANAGGFGTGEFVTVNCDIASGSYPHAADFSLSDPSVADLNGASITGLTAGFTADIQ